MVNDLVAMKITGIAIAFILIYWIDKCGERFDLMWLMSGAGYMSLAFIMMSELEILSTTTSGIGYLILFGGFIKFLYNIKLIFTQRKFAFKE